MVAELREREPHVLGERLGAFLDGELPQTEAEAVRSHLATCPACRTDADALGQAGALLREAVAAEPAPDPEVVWRAVRAHLAADTPAAVPVSARPRLRLPMWLIRPRPITWVAATLLLAAGLALFQTQERLTRSPESPALPPPSLAAGPPAVVETLEAGSGATVMLYAPPESTVPVIWVFEGESMEVPNAPPSPDAGTT